MNQSTTARYHLNDSPAFSSCQTLNFEDSSATYQCSIYNKRQNPWLVNVVPPNWPVSIELQDCLRFLSLCRVSMRLKSLWNLSSLRPNRKPLSWQTISRESHLRSARILTVEDIEPQPDVLYIMICNAVQGKLFLHNGHHWDMTYDNDSVVCSIWISYATLKRYMNTKR